MPLFKGTFLDLQVFCSFVDFERCREEVKRVLRPGGKFLFLEHIGGKPGSILRTVQGLCRYAWKLTCDGCDLTREKIVKIKKSGGTVAEAAERVTAAIAGCSGGVSQQFKAGSHAAWHISCGSQYSEQPAFQQQTSRLEWAGFHCGPNISMLVVQKRNFDCLGMFPSIACSVPNTGHVQVSPICCSGWQMLGCNAFACKDLFWRHVLGPLSQGLA